MFPKSSKGPFGHNKDQPWDEESNLVHHPAKSGGFLWQPSICLSPLKNKDMSSSDRVLSKPTGENILTKCKQHAELVRQT